MPKRVNMQRESEPNTSSDHAEDQPRTKKVRVGSQSSEIEDIRKSLEGEAARSSSVSEESGEEDSTQLPDYKKGDVNPDEYLQQLLEGLFGHRLVVKSALDLDDYFPEVTDEQIASYDIKVVAATRENKLDELKELYKKGQSMACCNRFGESLLHMACRRGFKEITRFLLNDAELKVRIRDDCGRTPMHDVCWNPKMQVELATMLVERDPTLLLISDKRGHTPFQYARPEDWRKWRKFLWENRSHLDSLGKEESKQTFQ